MNSGGGASSAAVPKRGSRLDETKPGSGLPIVTEIAELHGGELKLGDAALGGLRAELVLPASSVRGDCRNASARMSRTDR